MIKIGENKMEKNEELKILGINIWKIFAYFILYSFLGYVIETIFGILTTGLWQCRQSFLYGPFLGIYGVGAVLIIVLSQYFHKNNFTLFLGGYIIGSITEYIISFLVENILHTKWWDYSNNILNMNGRVCLLYSVFWGILTVFLIKKFNPLLDQMINKIKDRISYKFIKAFLSFMIIFLMFDCLLTCYAQDMFVTRMVIQNHIETEDFERRKEVYKKLEEKDLLITFINTYWNDEKMIKTFPNMKIEDGNGNIVYLDSLLPEIQPYYKKIFEKN